MATSGVDPFRATEQQLLELLQTNRPLLPELAQWNKNLHLLQQSPQTQIVLARTESFVENAENIPQTKYSDYRLFQVTGDRCTYEHSYFLKRTKLNALALRLFLGQSELKDIVQDYLWSICEETNWVVPAHESVEIDLFAAETGFMLAELISVLANTLDDEVQNRVRAEIERRVFEPYLQRYSTFGWYEVHNNWNGVCNSSVAATFLWLERDPRRLTKAISLALAGLEVFLQNAFESDGSSTEGVGYWLYGLCNFVALSEMLHERTAGAINLLDSEHMRRIAAYPAKMRLSGAQFASFSDCRESVTFYPGVVARLAQRTEERSLLPLLHSTGDSGLPARWRMTMSLRDLLWWNGHADSTDTTGDSHLPVAGVARLTTKTENNTLIILAAKAGHNDEHHNQNDVGSFVVHCVRANASVGENLLTDPGTGLYTRQYFSEARYENIFANSFGHSVPRINGQLQTAGRKYAGTLEEIDISSDIKKLQMEFAGAYDIPALEKLQRQFFLQTSGPDAGQILLCDEFIFSQAGEVEEAFVTWHKVEVANNVALIYGGQHTLCVVLEEPQGVEFHLQELREQSETNEKPAVLKRLSCVLPQKLTQRCCLSFQVVTRCP